MKRGEVNFATISFDNIPGEKSEMPINNLIISQGETDFPEINLSCPYIVDGIAFIICTKGKGKLSVNLKEYVLRKNVVICILPGFIIELDECDENLSIEYLFFSMEYYSELHIFPKIEMVFIIDKNPTLNLNDEQFSILIEYHNLIIKRYPEKQLPLHSKIIRNLLRALFYEIMCLYANMDSEEEDLSINTRSQELAHQFTRLLSQNYMKERTVSFYANKMFITPKHLTKVIKSTLGHKPLELINKMTILHIQALLKSSNMTIAQISEELNFSTPSFFGRFFKKATGMTPAQYRAGK